VSVRARLTLWYIAVLGLGLSLFAGAVVWQTGQAASAALDTTLRQRAGDVAGDLRFNRGIVLRPDAPDEGAGQLGGTTLWVRVLGPEGRVALRQGPPFPGLPADLLSATRAGVYDRELAGERHVRVLVQPVVRDGRRAATVQIITTTDQIEAARRQLLETMGVAGGVILVAAALGGLFLADRALRPVDRITRLAARIGAGDLHCRLGDATEMRGRPARARADELGRLARTFDGMLARLEEADERRRRLTADAAHELATPVATIVCGAEVALRQPRDADSYRAALAHNLDEGRHLGRIVEDLLLLARADAGRLPLERELVELDEVCRQAARAVRPLADDRAVALRTSSPPGALLTMGDEGRLGQVVRNLLDNALRHTPAGGAVTLTLRLEPGGAGAADRTGGADWVVLRVRDTGQGVAPHERERIFERFHRGDVGETAATEGPRRAVGSGLGLAICKAIVEAHGGQIRVETNGLDTPGTGAQFVVVLPSINEDRG